MATYLDGKHNENMEHVDDKPTFSVKLTFTDIDAKNPLEAVKKALKWIQDEELGADNFVYDVENEITKEKFTVDLSEDEENSVLPNND